MIKKLLLKAIEKAKNNFDQYNFERYSAMLDRKKLTMAEYMDIRSYLGLSLD